MSGVGQVTVIGGGGAETHGNVGSVTYQQGELPPVPVVPDAEFDVLKALSEAIAGDDDALSRALSTDREKRDRVLAVLALIPDEKLRAETKAVMERGLGDQIAHDAVKAARPYFRRVSGMLRDFTFSFERVEEHGRGVRLAARWTFFDAIQGKDFTHQQFSYPRCALGRVGDIAIFMRDTLAQVATRAVHEAP